MLVGIVEVDETLIGRGAVMRRVRYVLIRPGFMEIVVGLLFIFRRLDGAPPLGQGLHGLWACPFANRGRAVAVPGVIRGPVPCRDGRGPLIDPRGHLDLSEP